MQESTALAEADIPTSHLECSDLKLGYPVSNGWKPVVLGVSFSIRQGETVAIVGESGSGKSTIAKALVKLIPVHSGSIRFAGSEIAPMDKKEFLPYRKKIQLVLQDPWHALNPRQPVQRLLEEPLQVHSIGDSRKDRRERIEALLKAVHLQPEIADRLPGELSGGQRQRILLARALAVEPELLICDEPVSALDVSIQARLLQLLQELKRVHNLSLLLISHDLAVVQQMADRILVMQEGKAVEWKNTSDLFRHPEHPYTRMLIDACPAW